MAARFSQLRELARQYAAGQLSFEDYRKERTALLDDVAAGKVKIEYREITPPKPATPPTVLIDVGDDEPETRRVPIILGAAAILLAFVAGGWFVLQNQTAPPAVVQNVAPKDPAVQAVEDFLAAKDWSAAGIASFESRWDELTPEQQDAARRDGAFARLESEVRARIDDQNSLIGVDNSGQAVSEAARLRAFAAKFGINTD